MNITQEKVDDLNLVVRVKLEPADYKPRYENSLKNYSKKVNIKGFRPGHAPLAMVKKLYGKTILAEEVNNLLNDTLQNFIKEHNLEILGNPLPKDDQEKMEFHENAPLEFSYDLGLAPKLDFDFSKLKVHYHTLLVDDALMDRQIEDLTRRYGKLDNVDTSADKDMLFGKFEELDENMAVKENGITNTSTISIEYITDEDTKKILSGLTVGAHVTVDADKVSHNASDKASMLNISKEDAENVKSAFRFTVNEIKRLIPAELNEELFTRLFGEGVIADENAFRVKIKEDLEKMFSFDGDRMFFKEATNQILEKFPVKLPDAFLKRWIIATNEKPISDTELENEYPGYAKGLVWQLIENNIIKSQDLKVSHEEALEYTKGYLNDQYRRYGLPPLEDERIAEGAMRILTNREESRKIYDELYNRKVMMYLKGIMTLDPHPVPYDDFVHMLNTGHHHHHDHDHDHEHEHEHSH